MESIRNDKIKLEAIINDAVSEFVFKHQDFDINIIINVDMHRHKKALACKNEITGRDIKTSVILTM